MSRTFCFRTVCWMTVAVVAACAGAPPGWAGPTSLPVGARAIALGGSAAAAIEDVYAVYHNPAMLDTVSRIQTAAEFSGVNLGAGDLLSRSFAGAAVPTASRGTFGLYWDNCSAAGIYAENTVGIAYGRRGLRGSGFLSSLSVGIRIKVLGISYAAPGTVYDNDGYAVSGGDDLFAGGSIRTAFSVDGGLVWHPANNYRVGLAINDAAEPNISLVSEPGVVVPRQIVLGVVNSGGAHQFTVDVGMRGDESFAAIGLARRVATPVTLFGSFRYAGRNGSRVMHSVEPAFGAECRFNDVALTYALRWPVSELETFGSHTLSVSCLFGPVIRVQEDTVALRATVGALSEQVRRQESEIASLRRRLDDLLNRQPRPAPAPAPVPQPAPQRTQPDVAEKQRRMDEQKYLDVSEQYFAKREEMSFLERLRLVELVLRQFKDTQVNISRMEAEYRSLVGQRDTMRKEHENSRAYYQKLRKRGAPKEDLLFVLERIVEKYQPYGVDVQWVETERRELKQ